MKTLAQILFSSALLAGSVFAQQTTIQFAPSPIPPGYDPALQVPQFADLCPDLKMPDNYIYVKSPAKEGWTMRRLMEKGVTHWTKGDTANETFFRTDPAYAKRGYNNIPTIRNLFHVTADSNGNYWPNGYLNETQARDAARACDIQPRLWIGQTMEGDDYVSPYEPMWGWFYDELIKRYEAQMAQDGVQYYIAHNYFSRWPSIYTVGYESRAKHESLYNTPCSSWPVSMHTPGQTLGGLNTIVEDIYLGTPDLAWSELLQALMHMELIQKMGKFTGLFTYNVHEWKPGVASKIDYPGEGTFYRSYKPALDPNLQIAMAFLAYEYGTIWVDWGLGSYMSATKKPLDYNPTYNLGKDNWYATGQTTPSNPCPFYSQNATNRYNAMAYLGDMTHFGMMLWHSTGAQVVGGTPYYATFKIDSANWTVRQANGSDVIACYYEKRGLCKLRILGNKMLICYFNFFADNNSHTIEVQHPLNPSQTFVGTVCGNGVHAVVVDF